MCCQLITTLFLLHWIYQVGDKKLLYCCLLSSSRTLLYIAMCKCSCESCKILRWEWRVDARKIVEPNCQEILMNIFRVEVWKCLLILSNQLENRKATLDLFLPFITWQEIILKVTLSCFKLIVLNEVRKHWQKCCVSHVYWCPAVRTEKIQASWKRPQKRPEGGGGSEPYAQSPVKTAKII